MSFGLDKASKEPPFEHGEYLDRAAASSNGTQTLIPLATWVRNPDVHREGERWEDEQGRRFCLLSESNPRHKNVLRMTQVRGVAGGLGQREFYVMQALPPLRMRKPKGFGVPTYENADVDFVTRLPNYEVLQVFTKRGNDVAILRVRRKH